jgi:U4/U6.U5 tri-snRNP component SNU23
MASSGAYGANRASDTDFRKKWDKEEFAEKAKLKDQEERERMQENEERLKQGRPPLPHPLAIPQHLTDR